MEQISDPAHRGQGEGKDAASLAPSRNRDKIRCLDGLRGIACLLVFNYHFLWPWTPAIMMGYGAMPPKSPEPYYSPISLPILCLLNRGRPMVAIFFAISGYVLCRHILRSIHEGRLEAAYRSLSSSVFRRVFRLYIPPTASMLLVAILAQVGVFRSETTIYKGPDSVYINGSISTVNWTLPCINGTFTVPGAAGVAASLGLRTSEYLVNTTTWPDTVCLNVTSQLSGPAGLYAWEDESELPLSNKTTLPKAALHPQSKQSSARLQVEGHRTSKAVNASDLVWVQLGGSWEEHPHIHDNLTYALQNFTRAYAEWANPFNFGHYHTRYDPHTFTIPMELRGSMFIYLFLLGAAALKTAWRLRLAGLLSAYSLVMGRWDMATFLGGAMLSDIDVWRSSGHNELSNEEMLAPPVTVGGRERHDKFRSAPPRRTVLRWITFFVALYFLSYPDAGAEYTPGFVLLSWLVPKYYVPLSGWMFYQSMGALLLLPCILHSPLLRGLFERPVAQYMGRISFSFYLVHGPVLHSLGFWIMPRLFDYFSRPVAFAVGWVILMAVTLVLSGWWYRKVDVWSMTIGKRIERLLID